MPLNTSYTNLYCVIIKKVTCTFSCRHGEADTESLIYYSFNFELFLKIALTKQAPWKGLY